MEENITTTHVMFPLCFKVTTWHEIKKLWDKIITKLHAVIFTLIASMLFDAKKEENEVERDGK